MTPAVKKPAPIATTVVRSNTGPNASVTQDGLDTASSVRTVIAPGAEGAEGAEPEDKAAPAAGAAPDDDNAPGPPGPPGPPAPDDDNAPGPPGPPMPGAPSDEAGGVDEVQTIPGSPALVTDDYWEVGLSGHRLTAGYGNWSSVYARTQYRLDERNALLAELETSREFGESGTYFALGDTHSFNNDWYGSLTVGSSTSGSYLPRVRVDAFINRKLLRQRNLVATFGAGYYKARDVHHDHNLSLGATYYFAPKWILEGGVLFNNSDPGSVSSTSQFLALTYGQERQRYITLRLGGGREAYQFVGPTSELVDFPSNESSITLRQWLGESRGINLVLDRYSNSGYRSTGASLGYFQNY